LNRKKRHPFYFSNNSVKNWPIFILIDNIFEHISNHSYNVSYVPYLNDVSALSDETYKVVFSEYSIAKNNKINGHFYGSQCSQ